MVRMERWGSGLVRVVIIIKMSLYKRENILWYLSVAYSDLGPLSK